MLALVRLAIDLDIVKLRIYFDSQLVVNQISGDYMAKDERIEAYHTLAKRELTRIPEFSIQQVRRAQNSHANALAALASTTDVGRERIVMIECKTESSITASALDQIQNDDLQQSWMDAIITYLRDGGLPKERR